MRAQVTVEYMVLALVALALLSISVFSLRYVKDSSDRVYHAAAFRSSVADLAGAIGEVCALGNGNSRIVYVKEELDVHPGQTGDHYYASFVSSNLSSVQETYCPVRDASGLDGKTQITNENGEIKISSA